MAVHQNTPNNPNNLLIMFSLKRLIHTNTELYAQEVKLNLKLYKNNNNYYF